MAKASVKSTDVDKYSNLTLTELESVIDALQANQRSSPTATTNQDLTAARFALQQRQHLIKSKVMEFERTNSNYLLLGIIFCSDYR